MKRKLAGVLLLLFLVSCSWPLGGGTDKKLTVKAQAILFMNTYKAEIKDLQSLSALGAKATPAQTQLFKEKQRILTQMKPLVDLYNAVADANGTPDETLQSNLNNLVNQLVAVSGGVK